MSGVGPYMESNEPFNPIPGLMAGGAFGAMAGAGLGWAGTGAYNNIDGGVKRLLKDSMKKDVNSFNRADQALNGNAGESAKTGSTGEAKVQNGNTAHQGGQAQRRLDNSNIIYTDPDGNAQSPYREQHHEPVRHAPAAQGTRSVSQVKEAQEHRPRKDVTPPSAADLDRQALEDYKNGMFDSANDKNNKFNKLENRSKMTGGRRAGVIGGVALGASLIGGTLGAIGNYD